MGILRRIKKRLPIIGSSPAPRTPPPPRPAPARKPFTEPAEEEPAVSARGDRDPSEWIAEIVKEHDIVLFMKGTPSSPKCGFSASAAQTLSGYKQSLYTVDVIEDPEVRQEVKTFSSWPTLPQIYVRGEFIGGSDILRELVLNGELDALLAPQEAEEDSAEESSDS